MYEFNRAYMKTEQNRKINMHGDDIKAIYTLEPRHGANSFYGKAKVIETKDGDLILMSYSTFVCSIDCTKKMMMKLWSGYSATTQRHINAFLEQYADYYRMNKSAWEAMECGKSYAIA